MFGFTALLKGNGLSFCDGKNAPAIRHKDFLCYNYMLNKFANDRIFLDNNKYLFILDGVVLNKHSFVKDNDEWSLYLLNSYENEGDTFFSKLRGSFSGLLYDKSADKYIVFTDHIGSRFLYYVSTDETLFVSSLISECYAFLKQNNLSYSLSRDNAYLLMTYGYMLEDRTLCDQIKKIEPGCYMTFQHGKVKQTQYCVIDNTPDLNISEEDALEIMDSEFRRVIKMEFDKDEEYGYRHVVALSGGLDSRMVSWVAHEMGYTRQLNMTFSQSAYLDETIPQQIASDLYHDWVFKSLDGGWWLEDVDLITRMTGGNVLYPGQAHGFSLEGILDFTGDLGMIHSGQIGDVAFSSPYGDNYDAPYLFGAGAYSTTLLDRIKDNIHLHGNYKNRELAQLYYRSFSGNYYSFNNAYNKTEAYAPFQDVDLLNNMFKIPVSIRRDYKLYFRWILKKYPKAANYIWEKRGCRINRKWGFIKYRGRTIRIETIPARILHRLGMIKLGGETNQDMNPIEYYYNSNPCLKQWIRDYIEANIGRINDEQLYNDIVSVSKGEDVMEKLQVVSLLSAIKLFF